MRIARPCEGWRIGLHLLSLGLVIGIPVADIQAGEVAFRRVQTVAYDDSTVLIRADTEGASVGGEERAILIGLPPTGRVRLMCAGTQGQRPERGDTQGVSSPRVLWEGYLRHQRVVAVGVGGSADSTTVDGFAVATPAFELKISGIRHSEQPVDPAGFGEQCFEPVYRAALANYEDAREWRVGQQMARGGLLGGSASVNPEDSDYLIMVPDTLLGSEVNDLVALRGAQGFSPCIVPTSTIPGGLADSTIKDYIETLYYSGKRAPVYVLLVGVSQSGSPAAMPTHHHYDYPDEPEALIGDEWFACVAGDDHLGDLFVGRIVAEDRQELADYVTKVEEYEKLPPTGSWQNNCLFIYRDAWAGDSIYQDLSANWVPPGWSSGAIRLDDYADCAGFKSEVWSQFQDPSYALVNVISGQTCGCLFMPSFGNYCFCGELVGGGDDVDSLNNLGRYPFMLLMSCRAGDFTCQPCIASEFVMAPSKGAIGALAPFDNTGPQSFRERFSEIVFEEMLYNKVPTAGQAAAISKLRYQLERPWDWPCAFQMQLFGDPGLRLVFNNTGDHEQWLPSPGAEVVDNGAASCDLTGAGTPDILFAQLVCEELWNGLYERSVVLRLLKNIGPLGEIAGWSNETVVGIAGVETHPIRGLGAAIGDLLGGFPPLGAGSDQYNQPTTEWQPDGQPDLILVAAFDDDCFAINVGQGIHLNAGMTDLQFDSWSGWTYLPAGLCQLGSTCRGVGVDLVDLSDDGYPDLVLTASAGANRAFEYAVGRNLTVGGSAEDWEVETGTGLLPGTEYGTGCAVQDLNADGSPDLLVSFVFQDAYGHPRLSNKVGYSLDCWSGDVSEWSSYLEDLETPFEREPAGLGIARADVDFDTREDLVYVIAGGDYLDPGAAIHVVCGANQGFESSGFEPQDPPALQYSLGSDLANFVTNTARTIENDDSVAPRSGARYFKISGEDASSGDSRASVTLFDQSFRVQDGMRLSYWLYVADSPGGYGHVGLDLALDSGRASGNPSVEDQYGHSMSPSARRVPEGSWQRYICDLAPLAGATVHEVLFVYDDSLSSEVGELAAYVDDVELLMPRGDVDPDSCRVVASGDSLLFCPADCSDTLSVTVVVRDSTGAPVAGVDPDDIYIVVRDQAEGLGWAFYHCSGWRTWTAEKPTDENGETRIDLWGEIGGCLTVNIDGYVAGEGVGSASALLHSFDINGNGHVNAVDLAIFGQHYGSYYWCCNFSAPATTNVNLVDLGCLGAHNGHQCAGSVLQCAAPEAGSLEMSLEEIECGASDAGCVRYAPVFGGVAEYRAFDLELSLPEGTEFLRWEFTDDFEPTVTIGPVVQGDARNVKISAASSDPVAARSPGSFVVRPSRGDGGQPSIVCAVVCGPEFEELVYAGGESADPGKEGRGVPTLTLYPSPFSEKATISLRVENTSSVRVRVYDVAGCVVRDLGKAEAGPGVYEVVWDGLRDLGGVAAPGIYFVRAEVGKTSVTEKLVLLK